MKKSLLELRAEHPGFNLPCQYRIGEPLGHSLICFQNFYSQVLPNQETPVDLHLCFFAENGTQLEYANIPIPTAGFAQVDAATLGVNEPGLVVVMAVPRFDLAGLSQGRFRLKNRKGTGYYIVWQGHGGQVDTMHEWLDITDTLLPRRSLYAVYSADKGALVRHGIVLINPILGRDSIPSLTVYTLDKKLLGQVQVDVIPSMGSRMLFLDELFPDFHVWLEMHRHLGVGFHGANLVEPLTVEFHSSGDFHIHHIN